MIRLEARLYNMATKMLGEFVAPQPTPTIEDQIKSKSEELRDYESRRESMSCTKQEYLGEVKRLQAELQALVEQNDQIIVENRLAYQKAYSEYTSDVEAIISSSENVAKASRLVEIDNLVQKKISSIALDQLVIEGKITTDEKEAMEE